MPRSRYRIYDPDHAYFMTCTIVGWMPVFTRTEAVDIVYDSWRYLQREKGLRLYGYVILENHLHLIAQAPDLGNAIKSFKMYVAGEIIALLERRGAKPLLRAFTALKRRHKTKSTHQIWEEGSHPQQIQGDAMMLQKLEY